MAAKKTKRPTIEEELAEVVRAASDPSDPTNVERLRDALLRGRAIPAARAASAIGQKGLDAFDEDLKRAFERFLEDPVKADPGCRAKVAALEALDRREHLDPAPFVAAARYKQFEPAWGSPVDTAVGLRARAIAALARIGHPDILLVAAELLADKEPPVRRAAADALAHHGERAGAALALFKLRTGDEDQLVILACASALLSLAPDRGIAELRSLLFDGDEQLRELAALTLGESRREEAIDLLFEALDRTVLPEERKVLLRALGFCRHERARDFLLDRIATGSAPEAKAAVSALGEQRREPGIREKVEEAARLNERVTLDAAIAEVFGPTSKG
jgi:hypothetical protein